MMKKIFALSLLALVVGLVTFAAPVAPSKKSLTKSFNITNFDELKVSCIYDVEYEQTSSNTWSVEITAPENIFPYLEVKRSGHCLVLSVSKKLSTQGDYKLKAKVKAPVLNEVTLSGASSFKAGKINLAGNKMEIEASGASKYDIKSVVASKLEVDMSGASSANIGSVAVQTVDLEASGASEVTLRNVTADKIEVEANGASTATLAGKTDNVEVQASGSSVVKCGSLKSRIGKLSASGASEISSSVSNVLLQRSSGASTIKNKK